MTARCEAEERSMKETTGEGERWPTEWLRAFSRFKWEGVTDRTCKTLLSHTHAHTHRPVITFSNWPVFLSPVQPQLAPPPAATHAHTRLTRKFSQWQRGSRSFFATCEWVSEWKRGNRWGVGGGVDRDREAVLFQGTELEQETQTAPPRFGLTCHFPFWCSAKQTRVKFWCQSFSYCTFFSGVIIEMYLAVCHEQTVFVCHLGFIILWTVGVIALSTQPTNCSSAGCADGMKSLYLTSSAVNCFIHSFIHSFIQPSANTNKKNNSCVTLWFTSE